MQLQDKVAVVTGASDGIGLACARRFATEGARVVLADINTAKGEREAAALREVGHHAMFVACDVGSKAEVQATVDAVVEQWGRVDCLLANAGIVHVESFLDLEEDDFDRVLRTNLKGIIVNKYRQNGTFFKDNTEKVNLFNNWIQRQRQSASK